MTRFFWFSGSRGSGRAVQVDLRRCNRGDDLFEDRVGLERKLTRELLLSVQERHGVRGLDIGIKKPGDPNKVVPRTALDPLKVDPQDFKLEFDNDQVRVLRLKDTPPGQGSGGRV